MFTIITALYKSERYLEGYLKRLSHFMKEFERRNIPLEVVFVPQHPTPIEKELLGRAAQNPRIRIVESPIPSLYKAWNVGVAAAKGEIIHFWNVDDNRYADGLAEGVDLIGKRADFVYFPFRIKRYLNIFGRSFLVHIQRIDKQVPEFNEATYREFTRSMHCGFFIFRKTLYDKVGPFDEQFKIVGDFDWCVRAAKATKKFVRAKKLAGSFRVESDSRALSAGWKPRHIAENNIVYIRHGAHDKIIMADNQEVKNLMREYDSRKIFFDGKSYPVDDDGNFIADI